MPPSPSTTIPTWWSLANFCTGTCTCALTTGRTRKRLARLARQRPLVSHFLRRWCKFLGYEAVPLLAAVFMINRLALPSSGPQYRHQGLRWYRALSRAMYRSVSVSVVQRRLCCGSCARLFVASPPMKTSRIGREVEIVAGVSHTDIPQVCITHFRNLAVP